MEGYPSTFILLIVQGVVLQMRIFQSVVVVSSAAVVMECMRAS